ncbi:MAG: N-acetyltransferase [Bacteroidetes bacterium]|nr:N-acetyltransferase [Bacteroidota bacterium]
MPDYPITHDTTHQRFSLMVEGQESYLTYLVAADGSWNFNYSFTPPEHRGKGLARRLVVHAKAYCEAHAIRYRATCPYVAYTLERL